MSALKAKLFQYESFDKKTPGISFKPVINECAFFSADSEV